MRLLLIRHGQTPANVRGVLDTAIPGPRLTPLGERQAAEIPEALSNEPIERIAVSSMIRTRLTAEPLASTRGLEIDEYRGLHEIEAGDLEHRSDEASVRLYLTTVFAWAEGRLDERMPGGTDGHDFFTRYDDDIATIAEGCTGTAVVFSHGAAIRVWAGGMASNVDASFAEKNPLDNTGIVELDGSPDDGWVLNSWAGAPLGGPEVTDVAAEDPTGETLAEASGG